MNRFAFLSALALLAIGCAGKGAVPATQAAAPLPEPARTTSPASRTVELRHFYLLSPGPGARLVVTRSEGAAENR